MTYGERDGRVPRHAVPPRGAPDLDLVARWSPPRFEEPAGRAPAISARRSSRSLRLNLCSGEAKARHYDHEVKGLTVVKPLVGASSGWRIVDAVNPLQ